MFGDDVVVVMYFGGVVMVVGVILLMFISILLGNGVFNGNFNLVIVMDEILVFW